MGQRCSKKKRDLGNLMYYEKVGKVTFYLKDNVIWVEINLKCVMKIKYLSKI